MKASIAALVMAAVAGVSAHPSGAHGHRHMHRSADEAHQHLKPREFYIAQRPAPSSTSTTAAPTTTSTSSAPPPPPTTTSSSYAPPPPPPSSSAPPPASSSAPSSSSGGSSGGSGGAYIPFCGGKSKRATIAEIGYKGNTGGGTGCNLMTIPADIADQYDYTAVFTNKQSESVTCECWNKIGPDGGINGFFKGNQAVTFNVAAGGSAVVAIEANSQGGCSCAAGGPSLTGVGEFAGTWLEFDAADAANKAWSGADASCLVAAAAGLEIPALSVCFDGTCSTINAGGTGTNAYLGGMEAADGVGLNIPAGKFQLDVTVG